MSELVSMDWDTISINEEPMIIADILEEERESSDDSITSEESTDSSEERSERSAAENELDTDASNSSEESDDAEDVCICIEDVCICSENPFEDEEFQNSESGEIRDILARLDAVSKDLDDELDAINKELEDSEDKECLEMQAMVLGDYTEEELEESDSEDGIDQVANSEERDVIQEVIIGLGPQKTAQQWSGY